MADSIVRAPIVLLTAEHSISGTVILDDVRLSDLLNDTRESTLTLQDVQVSRLREPGNVLAKHSLAVIPKSKIILLFELTHEAIPSAKRFYSYVKKMRCPVFVVAGRLEISGVMFATHDLDQQSLRAMMGERFIPLGDARVTFSAYSRYVIQQSAILLNSRHISYLAVEETATSNPPKSNSAVQY